MPRFIVCSTLCRYSWLDNTALSCATTALPNQTAQGLVTNHETKTLKYRAFQKKLARHGCKTTKQPKTTNIYAIVKNNVFCRENLQIRALRKLWGIILRSPKASQLLPPCNGQNKFYAWSHVKIWNNIKGVCAPVVRVAQVGWLSASAK